MSDKPDNSELLSNSFWANASDWIPLMPSGARRAGAAALMAERIGEKPSWLMRNPILSQLLALSGGAALAGATGSGTVLGTSLPAGLGLLPIATVQHLRKQEMKDIQESYEREKKKRLKGFKPESTQAFGGSARLGALMALHAMRTGKQPELSALAEAMDVAPIAIGLGNSSAPLLANFVDHYEARKLKKAASDQSDLPVIPAAIAAAMLGVGGQVIAHNALHKGLAGDKSLDRKEWRGLVDHIADSTPTLVHRPRVANSFYLKPPDASPGLNPYVEAAFEQDPDRYLPKGLWERLRLGFDARFRPAAMASRENDLRQQITNEMLQNGMIVGGKGPFSSAKILAHEAGHAKIEANPGVVQFLQRHLYHRAPVMAPLAAIGSMAAGLKSEGAVKGALLGSLIGTLGTAGQMVPEFMATHHGLKGLKSYDGGRLQTDDQRADLLRALGTYAASNVLPSVLTGALGGYIGGRRKKKREKEL